MVAHLTIVTFLIIGEGNSEQLGSSFKEDRKEEITEMKISKMFTNFLTLKVI